MEVRMRVGAHAFDFAERTGHELHLLQSLKNKTQKKKSLPQVRQDKRDLNQSSTMEGPGGIYPNSRNHFEEEIVRDHSQVKKTV